MVQAHSESLSYSCAGAMNCKMLPFEHDVVQNIKKVSQSSTPNLSKIWCGKYLCKVKTWCMQFVRSYCVHKATWPWASLKVQKGQTSHYRTPPICWCDKHPYKGTALYKQYLRSYSVHKAAWPWASFESSKRSHKYQHWTRPRFWCGEHYSQATTWYRQSMKSYHVYKVLPDALHLKV